MVVNTLSEIQSHDGLIRLLETQPRLEDILYGKVDGDVGLRKDEIFVFYTTFVQLQKLLQKSSQLVDNQQDQKILKSALQKNERLIKFFFKTLYAADANDFILIREIKNLDDARDIFEYLSLLLPFI